MVSCHRRARPGWHGHLGGVRHWRIAHADSLARYRLISNLAVRLQPGTDKAAVERLLGVPDNRDNEYVWYWCCDSASRQQYDTWGKLHRYGKGPQTFVLFDTAGRLLTPGTLKGAEGSPWDAYREIMFNRLRKEMTKDEVKEYTESLLGPDPYADLWVQSEQAGDGNDP